MEGLVEPHAVCAVSRARLRKREASGPGEPLLAATAGMEGVVVLDRSGKAGGDGGGPERADQVILCEGRAVAATDRGTLIALALPAK